jgi:PAS domain S-box-containing protein
MIDWFQSLTSTTGFVPRRQCGDWTPGWITVHAGSDVLIWLAYLSIPLVLLAVARHAAVRPFRPMIGLFAAFILACGTTHLIEAVIFEHPIYRLGGVVKVLTAVVSWATVLALIPAVPRLLPLLDQLTTTPTAEPGPDPDAVKPAGLVYSLAILIALLAVLIRYAMHPVLGEYAPYMVSLLATVFVAWYGGFGPGLVTLLLSGVATVYLFVPPRGAFDLDDLSKQFGLGMFLFTGLGVLVLGGLQRETRRRLHGKVLQLWSAREEVTAEKRKADETLAALDAFVRNAPYGIAYFDPTLRYIRVNDTFASANGVPVDEHIGRVLTDVLPDFPPDLVANFHRVLDTGEPLTRHIVRGPETVWELTAFPVPLTDSRHGLGVIGVDVTDRQRHEEQLRQSEARFRQLAEVMPQIVWVARGDGHREYYNSRWYEYTGLTVEQSAGREGWVDALHPDDRERGRAAWLHSVETGNLYQIEYRFRDRHGDYRWFLGRAEAVRDESGQIVRWLGTCTDIDRQVRAAEDLREARRFAESVLHSLSSHLAVIDADGNIISVNESWRQFGVANGVPPDYDWLTANYYAASRPDEYGRRATDGIRAVARGERGAFEMEYPCHGNGQERYFVLRANRFRGDGPVRLVITHENVTDRVLAERQLRESASQLLQLTEGMPLLMWACRPNGECDYLSRQWLDYTGETLESQLGKGWIASVHPEDRAAATAAWQASVDGSIAYDVEYRLRRHDGVYRWFATRGIPVRDQAGRITRWYGSCTDIDDRKHYRDNLELMVAERTAQIREQQIFLNTTLDNIAEGVVACDASGRLKLFNAAARRMHALPLEPLAADRWTERYRLYEADGATPMPTDNIPLYRAWRGESVRDAELVIRAVGQPDRYLVCFGQQLRGPDGTVSGAVVSMRDVTERREYERQLLLTHAALRASNEDLEKFAYVASHDLQEPLRKIQAFGTRLVDRYRDALGEQGQGYLDRMTEAAGRMRRLIEDLLALSRVSSKPITFQPVDLSELVQDVLGDLDEQVQRTGGRVEVGQLPTVVGDPGQLRQLFQNLIGNALKFARPEAPPEVRLTATELVQLPADADPPPSASSGWRITVSDNGIGFEPEYADRIFELFQRLHARTKYEGTGLGLAIVRKIALRHGATIVARGRPGEGATFVLDWPTQADQTV